MDLHCRRIARRRSRAFFNSRSMLFSFGLSASLAITERCGADPYGDISISAQSCNPILVLEAFWAEHFRNYSRAEKSIRIDDEGATWEATYFTPPEKRDPNRLHVGGDFPILIIDKASCKLMEAKFYQ